MFSYGTGLYFLRTPRLIYGKLSSSLDDSTLGMFGCQRAVFIASRFPTSRAFLFRNYIIVKMGVVISLTFIFVSAMLALINHCEIATTL